MSSLVNGKSMPARQAIQAPTRGVRLKLFGGSDLLNEGANQYYPQ